MKIETEFGYGVGAFGGRGVLTPYSGLSLSEDGARTWRLGGRLAAGQNLTFSLEGGRRETAGGTPDHGVMLRATTNW